MNHIPSTQHHQRVLEFMLRAKQECPRVPTMPDAKIRELRAKLILEEALETIQALGFAVRMESNTNEVKMSDLAMYPEYEPNLVEIADGCADISVVTIGTLIACGIKDQPVLEEVDGNNLAKFLPGHSWREDGKLIKPPGHQKADFAKVLAEQGWDGNQSSIRP